MTTLGGFHTDVADALGRSTSLSGVIPRRVKMAAQWLERNYTFQYMREWKVLNVSASAQYPYIISLHNMFVKGIDSIRRRDLDNDGNIIFDDPLKKVNPIDRTNRPKGKPESYWLNGRSSIILNSIPQEDYTYEAHMVRFTSWGEDDAWTHWLLDNAYQLLLVRTLMIMSPRLRDTKLWEVYKAEFDLEIQSFNVSEEEIQSGDFCAVYEPPDAAQSNDDLRSV